MASSKDIWDRMVDEEVTTNGKGPGGLGHDELRDRWLDLYPGYALSRGDWWEYHDGYWEMTDEIAIEGQIIDVLERSKKEGVKVTGGLVASVLRLIRAASRVEATAWDADPNVVVCANGTLELDTRTLREHRMEDYATGALPYEYDPEASADMFLDVLEQAIPDATDFLQEFAGYCLTTDTSYETALWFVGPRGSGKSTVIEGLKAMLGPRQGILGLAEIESSTFALARIPGKTLLSSTEQPASYLKSTHIIDALISGEEIMIDRKYREAEMYTPVAKVVWAMNDKPRIGNTTSGIFRRVKVVEFPELKEEADPRVKAAIKDEGAGILNWALNGLDRLIERGKFEIPESVRLATEEFEKSNDLPAMFVEERCDLGPLKEIQSGALYTQYKLWCEDNGHKAQSSTRLAEDWKRLGFQRKTLNGRKVWSGLEMK